MPLHSNAGSTGLLCNGDARTFREIYDQYYHAIYTFCQQRLDREDAQDVVAETFHTLWMSWEKMGGKEHVRNFLYLVARQKIFDLAKKNAKKNRVITVPDLGFDLADGNAEDTNLYAIILGELPRLIETLSKQCKEVMKLYLEERPVAEIADMLKINSKTVYEHRAIAIRRLRKGLQNSGVL